MNPQKNFSNYSTIAKYLSCDNETIRRTVALATNNVIKAARQSIQSLQENLDFISDVADHLDNKFVTELGYTQIDEIKEINKLEKEFLRYYNDVIWKTQLGKLNKELIDRASKLDRLEKELREKEANIEETIRVRVAEAEARMREKGTSSHHLFENALKKADKVIDQTKITRFAYSTIFKFHEEFKDIMGNNDVELITRLFQETIEPFQSTKFIIDKDGNKVKVVKNTFPEDCYQDLFLFFYRYYAELIEMYSEEQELPSTTMELARIFKKKKIETSDIVKNVHRKREATQKTEPLHVEY